jgi:adenosine deaminase
MRRELLKLPKTDIHCHLDGSVRPATLLELARRLKIKLPADNAEDLKRFVQVSPTCRSLKEFLDIFELIYPILRDPLSVERIAYELVEDCAKENTRHVEARFAPVLQESAKFPCEQVVEAALKGLRRGFKDFGTTSSIIICMIRSHGPKENRRAFDTLKKFFRAQDTLEEPCVVALDLAGDEARYPTRDYAAFYEEARALGMWTTCHAGETSGTENLRTALDLQVGRIGHGIHLMEDQKLVAEVARRKVPIEIGISSNVLTKSVPDLMSHPALDFHRAGVAITLNTDDRGIIGSDLTREYEQALTLGFTYPELQRLAIDSTDHLFLPAHNRQKLRRRFESEAAAVLQEQKT